VAKIDEGIEKDDQNIGQETGDSGKLIHCC
jgi:hypothetical protein